MEITYVKSESTVKPPILEEFPSTVYIRKNIVEETRTDDYTKETYTMYTYDEAALDPEEYEEYAKHLVTETAIKGENDSAKISNIENGVKLSDINQLDLMEAVTEIYEMMIAKQV